MRIPDLASMIEGVEHENSKEIVEIIFDQKVLNGILSVEPVKRLVGDSPCIPNRKTQRRQK